MPSSQARWAFVVPGHRPNSGALNDTAHSWFCRRAFVADARPQNPTTRGGRAMLELHKTPAYNCHTCGRVFTTAQQLKAHRIGAHG